MLTPAQKQEILKKFGTSERDTASPQVQVAMITKRLAYLNDHFKKNKKDHHSRTGLMRLVGRRRRLLDYLKGRKPEEYRKLISELGIRK